MPVPADGGCARGGGPGGGHVPVGVAGDREVRGHRRSSEDVAPEDRDERREPLGPSAAEAEAGAGGAGCGGGESGGGACRGSRGGAGGASGAAAGPAGGDLAALSGITE